MPNTPKGTKRGPVGTYRGEFRITEKLCKKCGGTKPLSEFGVSRYKTMSGNSGVRITTHCRECQRARKRAYHKENRTKFVAKAKAWAEANPERYREQHRGIQHRKRLRRFGITQAEYDALLSAQAGLCAVCGQLPPVHHCRRFAGADSLSIDHSHKTGKVRGLLCRKCNLALGNISESEKIALGLLEYIRKHC